jgi:hypothetical protein
VTWEEPFQPHVMFSEHNTFSPYAWKLLSFCISPLCYLFYPIPIAISTAKNAQQTLNLKAQAGVNYIRITNS